MIEVVKNMDEVLYDDFVAKHHGTIYQSSAWARIANEWLSQRIGVVEEEALIGTTLILFKPVEGTPYKLAYMPRGPVCDYQDVEIFKKVLQACIDVAKEENAFQLKFDPQIERDAGQDIKDYVESIGGTHRGYDKGMVYSQPNFLMITKLDEDYEDLYERFDDRIHDYIAKGNQKGVRIHLAGPHDATDFEYIMNASPSNEQIDKKNARYFQHLLSVLEDDAQLYIVKLHLKQSLDAKLSDQEDLLQERRNIEAALAFKADKSEKQVETLNKQLLALNNHLDQSQAFIEEVQDRIQKGETEVLLAGAILAFFGDTTYYLYAGSSNDFKELMPNHLLMWTLLTDGVELGFSYFDFGGVSGYTDADCLNDPLFELYEFKKAFASEMVETIGEFDLVLLPDVDKSLETRMGIPTIPKT